MKLYVCISLDVEEEGLFTSHYPRSNLSLANVPLIRRLEPLYGELGLPLTLFCAYSVFANDQAANAVLWMRDHCSAEIGAHLHHWNTPPLENDAESAPPCHTHLLPPELLEQRLANLLKLGAQVAGAPLTSFRMGRWDLKNILLPLLAKYAIRVDSSICPLRIFAGGADHFLAPCQPYWVQITPCQRILEAPVTQIPLLPALARLWRKFAPPSLMDAFHFFGALSANPLWHCALIRRLAARLHTWRGGTVLNFFWHSSEMMPKGSPHIPNQAAADRLLGDIFAFCRWLNEHYDVQPVTASQLAALPLPYPARFSLGGPGDW